MASSPDTQTCIHRFEHGGKRFAIDPETCFCFECDGISWDVLEYYPDLPVNRIYHLLKDRYDHKELEEVVGELEWLRATKSILTARKPEERVKAFEVERGVRHVCVALPQDAGTPVTTGRSWLRLTPRPNTSEPSELRTRRAGLVRDAMAMLLGRSGTQTDLSFELVERGAVSDAREIAAMCSESLKSGRLAGKKVTVHFRLDDISVAKCPEPLRGHSVGAVLEFTGVDEAGIAASIEGLGKAAGDSLGRLAKVLETDTAGVTGRIVVCPARAQFHDAVRVLDEAGFTVIELDIDGAFAKTRGLDPNAVLESLDATAVYYAQRLLSRHYFRLDPLASIFRRIYDGKPTARMDPAGTNALVVDESGDVYPSRGLMEVTRKGEPFRLGSVRNGVLDEDRIRRYEDIGTLTTPACVRCWVRNLCGGGISAVHHALTGSFRTPHAPWCDMQRTWMGASVSAFQQLSSQGVNFDRMYKSLGRKSEKPSLFTLARVAFTMNIGVRPIEEADAKMLVHWENWSEASYFTCCEGGVLLGSVHEREMDSLHHRGIEQELVLIRKTGEPMGLFKIRPEAMPGVARAWLYLRNELDYSAESVRKSFRTILDEASRQQSIQRLIVPVRQEESPLQGFLSAIGFTQAGVQRHALYLHGQYHDVATYRLVLN